MHKEPANNGFFELIEKRSRFITYSQKVCNPDEFKQFLTKLKALYPDARHYCYGYRVGTIKSAQRGFSDDGEPNGTAGMPILNVIDHSDFSDIAIIVVRYFGGTKLGTGGLARAYSEAANCVLKSLTWVNYEEKQEISLLCQFQQEHQLRYLIKQLSGEIKSVAYSQQVKLSISIAADADLGTLTLYRVDQGDNGTR